MAIEVECPQGHKISCPDEKAGQVAKCPKCGSSFTIPAEQANDQNGNGDTIVFLCPNGHKLNGPASLQGKPGQCPHCDAKFMIPDYSESEEEYDEEDGLSDALAAPNPPDLDLEPLNPPDLQELGAMDPLDDLGATGDVPLEGQPVAVALATPGEAMDLGIGAHPMATVFEAFWNQRGSDATIEIHLRGGEKIVPDFYAQDMSQQDHAVLAIRNDDASYTLTAITWDSLAQVRLRGVKRLPSGYSS